jgi:dihydrofolate reductase
VAIKLICAVDSNWSIGFKSELLFRIPDDLKRFKKLTEHQFCVSGKHTFESIINYNGKPLPNRINVVLTHNSKYEVPLGVFKFDSVEKIINHYNSGTQDKNLMIIGGENTFNQFMQYADEVLITYIDAEAPKTDTYFNREALEKDFYIGGSERHYCETNGIDFYYVTYKRK